MQISFGYLDVPLNMEAIKTKAGGGGGEAAQGRGRKKQMGSSQKDTGTALQSNMSVKINKYKFI